MEPLFECLESDHSSDQCWLVGSKDDALRGVLDAAGSNALGLLRVIALNHGVKIAEGSPEAVRTHPEVLRAYLGADAA